MRRFPLPFVGTVLSAFLVALFLTGCPSKNRDEGDEDFTPTKSSGSTPVVKTATKKPVKGDYSGIIKGKVAWKGGDDLIKQAEEGLKIANDKDYCINGKLPTDKPDFKPTIKSCETEQQSFRVGKNGNLGNVFVWIEPESGFYFDVPKEQLDKVAKEVLIGQPHCAFVPHAAVVFPSTYKDGKLVPTGQKLIIENNARVSHNVSFNGGSDNGTANQTVAPGSSFSRPTVFPSKEKIAISCSIHGWMNGVIRAFDHPYATVTSVGYDRKKELPENKDDPNFGTFEITGVPVGAKVKLFVWHEKLDYLVRGDTITLEKVTVKDDLVAPK